MPAPSHADDLQINAARRLDLALVGIQDVFLDLPQIAGSPRVDDNSLAPAAVVYKGCGNGKVIGGNPALPLD
jgi:hypothetical protein